MIAWSDSLSIGIAAIDEQHRAFLGLLNRLYTLSRTDADRRELRTILAELLNYAATHFSEEEAHMTRTGYPLLAEHRAKHEAAAAKIHDLVTHDADEMDLYRFLGNFVEAWLVKHIMGADREFGIWLQTGELPDRSGGDADKPRARARCACAAK